MKKIAVVGSLAAVLALFLYVSKNKNVVKTQKNDPDATKTGSGTRGQRNNNPFNIRYSKANEWKGQTGSDGSFCVFDTMAHGIRAGGVLLRNYLKNGTNTIEKILAKFAPATENNTAGYVSNVEKMSGINRGHVLNNTELWRIAVPMMWIESKYKATTTDRQYFETT